MSANPQATIRGIYEAVQRGDLSHILSVVADDVQWEAWGDNSAQAAGVPWLARRSGRSGVAEFFQAFAAMQLHAMEIRDVLASEHQVAVEFVIEVTTPSGSRLRDEELHLWTLNPAGQVVRMRHYVDTAKHIRAAGLG